MTKYVFDYLKLISNFHKWVKNRFFKFKDGNRNLIKVKWEWSSGLFLKNIKYKGQALLVAGTALWLARDIAENNAGACVLIISSELR